jgi:hypothetical protein
MHKEKSENGPNFHLNKWFLDFKGETGEVMIFYAAQLSWHGWSVSYCSWLNYDPIKGVNLKSGFRKVQFPQVNDNLVTWSDLKYDITGTWLALTGMIQSRIFNSSEGYLDWKCYQPASKVTLRIKDKILEGKGYAEQIISTVPPWKIPMDELRWGHFGADGHNLVWIELKENVQQQWLWLNGEKMEYCIIEDGLISIPGKDLILQLDRNVLLESEKKIYSVVGKIVRFIPGFNKFIPHGFLMADEKKWFSLGQLQIQGKKLSNGFSIHEHVNFKVP